MPKQIALVDTREQTPLLLPAKYWKTSSATLSIGDYTTTRLHGKYAVERKSLPDFIRTFGLAGEQRRFRTRTQKYPRVRVDLLVEASHAQIRGALKRGLYCSPKNPNVFLQNVVELIRQRNGMLVFGEQADMGSNAELLHILLSSASAI